MSQTENQNHSDSSNSKEKPLLIGEEKEKEKEVGKQTFRRKVWEHLEKHKLINFPRPVYGRIPNFKGSDEAAAKLLELDEFKNVEYIEVNPDKPQEAARILVLESRKNLYVPVPRLKDGLLKCVTVPEDATKNAIKNAVSRRGLEFAGRTVGATDEIRIDLLVLGSVAVSREGYRIGKGRGYADLEFAVLLEMNAISDKTVIVTTVHDSQVFDTLPKEIFKEYDVPVDYILTPTQIIKTVQRLPRPEGIFWNILSQRRVNLMPVLKALKEIHESKGKDTTLKEVDTDVESYEQRRHNYRFRRFRQRRPLSETKNSESQGEETNNENVCPTTPYQKSLKFFKRRRVTRKQDKPSENGDTSVGENGNATAKPVNAKRNLNLPYHRYKRQIDFSLMVSNIEKNVRVRDLKNALIERGIKPNVITWRGYKGVCYLHYAKTGSKAAAAAKSEENQQPQPQQTPIVVDNVIEILQNLKIGADTEKSLSVKIMEPISRIETTNVTAV